MVKAKGEEGRAKAQPDAAPATPSDGVVPHEGAICCAVFAVSLGVYGATLHPSVAGGDMGELATVSHDLAVPHPPGYPTLAMSTYAAGEVARLVAPSVPVGVAQNAFHALLSAAANAVLFLAGSRLADSAAAGVLAAGIFAFAPIVWTYATHVEVFSLNNLFIHVLELLCVMHWRSWHKDEATRLRIVQWGSFCSGLALTNQHTSVVYVAPFVLWVACCEWRKVFCSPTFFARIFVLFLLGISPYIYLPLCATYRPSAHSWGDTGTWEGFLTHFFRKEYGTFSLASKEANYRAADFERAWRYYLWDCRGQTMQVMWVFAVAGILVSLFRWVVRDRLRRMDAACMFSLTLALYLNFFHYFCNLPIDKPLFYGVQQRFWIQPLSLLSLLLGYGAAAAVDVPFRGRGWRPSRSLAALVVASAVAAAHARMHWTEMDQTGNDIVEGFGRAILRPLPKGAVLLTKGDIMINSARYVQTLAGFRTDVRIVDQEMLTYYWYVNALRKVYPELKFPGEYYYPNRQNTFDIATFFAANRKKTCFLAHGFKEGDHSWHGKYESRPFGIIQQVVKAKASQDLSLSRLRGYLNATRNALPLPSDFSLPPPGKYAEWTWEQVVKNDFWWGWHSKAYHLLSWFQKLNAHKPDDLDTEGAQYLAVKEAVHHFQVIVNATHTEPAGGLALRNLGVALQGLHRYHPQEMWIVRGMRDAFRDYVALMKGDPAAKDVDSVQQAVEYYDQILLQADMQSGRGKKKRGR